ncbi:PIR protein, putative [Plasmodium sp. gorilla clade G1]|nr:PIR protein, putative [Plasmodium sp. gorilla clade G1]
MKFNYTNILLFSLSLNILLLKSNVYKQRKHYITHHTHKPSTRLLCECDLYTSIYDNDPEMKSVMENYNRQTSERYKEYYEHMIKNRQRCKEKCDKDIQKIILKDKIEKELTEKLSTLQKDISIDDIPTCVCENFLAEKTEKFCLNCGYGLGGVVPGLGFMSGMALYTINLLKVEAIASAINFATKEGIKAGIQVGIEAAIKGVKTTFDLHTLGGVTLDKLITAKTFKDQMFFVRHIVGEYNLMVDSHTVHTHGVFSFWQGLFNDNTSRVTASISASASDVATKAGQAAAKTTTEITKTITLEKTTEIIGVSTNYSIAIIASIIVIVAIVLVMIIIYLILCYLRKKKMKKKLQYIKLLKE